MSKKSNVPVVEEAAVEEVVVEEPVVDDLAAILDSEEDLEVDEGEGEEGASEATIEPVAPVEEKTLLATAETDLRVVTDDYTVFWLYAEVPRALPESMAFAAQRAGAEQKVRVTLAEQRL